MIALVVIALLWCAAIVWVLGLCQMAARGDGR